MNSSALTATLTATIADFTWHYLPSGLGVSIPRAEQITLYSGTIASTSPTVATASTAATAATASSTTPLSLPALTAPVPEPVATPLTAPGTADSSELWPEVASTPVLDHPNRTFNRLILALLIIIGLTILGLATIYFGPILYTKYFASATPLEVITPITPAVTAPVTPPVTPTATIAEPTPAVVIPGSDTDTDGLTNVEELLYKTDFRNSDSDGDSFLDGNEVFHGYDPLGLAPSTLLSNGTARIFSANNLDYTFTYPSSWIINTNSAPTTVILTPDNAVKFIFTQTSSTLTLEEFIKNDGDVSGVNLKPFSTKTGFGGKVSETDLIIYLQLGLDKFLKISYELSESLRVDYLQTFKMVANSIMGSVDKQTP